MITQVCGFKDSLGKYHDTHEAAKKANLSYYIRTKLAEAVSKKHYTLTGPMYAGEAVEYIVDNIDDIIKEYNGGV